MVRIGSRLGAGVIARLAVGRPPPALRHLRSRRFGRRQKVEAMQADDEQPVSEATRLAEKSTEAFEAAAEADSPAEQAIKLEVAQDAAGDSALAGAYVFLQKLVGGIALLLPFVVVIGDFALGGDELRSSISAYYYSPMGNVFVGALCALGVFFLSYQHKPLPGYKLDNQLSYGASAAAIGVALFPTAEHQAKAWSGEWFVSTAHLVCACILFILLATFSLKLFTRSDSSRPLSDAKRKRNTVFRVCGWTIVASIVLVAFSNLVEPPDSLRSLLWLETVGVVAFGVSWLVKSGIFGILVDRAPVAAPVLAPDPPPAPAG
jgi:hypothetical protein